MTAQGHEDGRIDHPGEPYLVDWPTPPKWRVVQRASDGVMWRAPGGLRVIASAQKFPSGDLWAHVSVSNGGRGVPTWAEMVGVRDAVLGSNVEAYQVCPPATRYVDLANVLHWWACLNRPDGVLPQFDAVVAGIRTI